MVLNCSKNGDRRFHPAYAKIELDGYEDTIQNIAAYSKRILKDGVVTSPINYLESKQYPTVGFVYAGKLLPYELYKYFVGLLWYRYLSANPSLVSELEKYNHYRDYGQIDDVSHSEFIARFMMKKENNDPLVLSLPDYGEVLYDHLSPLIDVLEGRKRILIDSVAPLDEAITEVVGYFQQLEELTNVRPPMISKTFYEKVYKEYYKMLRQKPQQLIGGCFVKHDKKTERKTIFLGLIEDGNNQSFRQALESIKHYCIRYSYTVSLPYHLGCEVDSSEWKLRYEMLEEIFIDYYVTLHKRI